ncbi:hypothetical protein MKK70_01545 [Methylobacterium sp. E-041]|uniref:hypothetical protein n=1 Tax=unclassified Methylobacterium TaxID=2615210 RepID=UPI001FBC0BFD|nr:hypothetical protein [Methylobacterium sp. E-041]MCJ2104089.1 hypothetical protein [Methylobacterium sp. E-041]
MTHRTITLAAAVALTIGTLAAAPASEATATGNAVAVPAVLGAGYHVPGVALGAADVRAQGGLLVPNLTRWRPASVAEASAERFQAPAAFTVAYRTRGIATNAAQVLKQGGFATAGAVRWLPDVPASAELGASTVTLGAL